MERQDRLSGNGWVFRYDDRFPPGTDSFLLSAFPRLRAGERVCDLGAGAGLLGLLLLRRQPSLRVTGVELDDAACALLRYNALQNGLEEHLCCLPGDLRQQALLPAGVFDLAVCNPPYFPVGSGASAPAPVRQAAREEITCTLSDVCAAAGWGLRWGGRLCLVHRPERLTDALCALRQAGLEPKRLRFVHKIAGAAPSLLLVEGRRGGRPGLTIEPPLVLQGPDGTPTAEVDAIYCRRAEDAL